MLFERALLVLLALLALQAARGITWFSFAAIVVVPAALSVERAERRLRRARAAAGVVVTSALAVVVAAVVALAQPASWFESSYPQSAAAAARDAAGGTGRVFANGAYSDWLLLSEPRLRGRVAYDARFELLPDGRLSDAAAVSIGRWDTSRILAPFDVVVLRPEETELRDALVRTRKWQQVATHTDVVVFRRVRA
jgi:hypothetical protein